MPDSFEGFEVAIKETYDKLVKEGVIEPQPDVPAPNVPLDLEAAKKQGKVCLYNSHPVSRWSIPLGAIETQDQNRESSRTGE